MPGFIEEFYYGNIEPQESNKEFKAVLKKMLSSPLFFPMKPQNSETTPNHLKAITIQ